MKQKNEKKGLFSPTAAVITGCLVIFILSAFLASAPKEDRQQAEEFAEYENGKVIEILSDNTVQDPVADIHHVQQPPVFLFAQFDVHEAPLPTSSQAPYPSPPPGVAKARSLRCSSFQMQSRRFAFVRKRDRAAVVFFIHRIIAEQQGQFHRKRIQFFSCHLPFHDIYY